MNGVFTLIGVQTGKIMDIEVLSSYCAQCNTFEKINCSEGTDEWQKWFDKHLPNCNRNHFGSSGSMEEDMVEIFSRSVEKYNVKYTSYLGDGDSSTYSNIVKSQSYGKNVQILKKECCGHVQKRFGTQMRKLKEQTKNI